MRQPATASRSQPASCSATRRHVCSRSTRARPALPRRSRVGRILEERRDGLRDAVHVGTVDEQPRLSVHQRFT